MTPATPVTGFSAWRTTMIFVVGIASLQRTNPDLPNDIRVSVQICTREYFPNQCDEVDLSDKKPVRCFFPYFVSITNMSALSLNLSFPFPLPFPGKVRRPTEARTHRSLFQPLELCRTGLIYRAARSTPFRPTRSALVATGLLLFRGSNVDGQFSPCRV